YAAYANDGRIGAQKFSQAANDSQRAFMYWWPGKASRFVGVRQALNCRSIQRRIGGDDTIHAVAGQQFGDGVHLFRGKVRRDLYRQGNAASVLIRQRFAAAL